MAGKNKGIFEKVCRVVETAPNYVKYVVAPHGKDTQLACETGDDISPNDLACALKAILHITYKELHQKGYGDAADWIREQITDAVEDESFWNRPELFENIDTVKYLS